MNNDKSSIASLANLTPRLDSFDRLLKLVNRQERIAKFAFAGPRPRPAEQVLARQVETKVSNLITALGYPVWPTPQNSPFDLWAGGARIEVKASRWINPQKPRYQAGIRNHRADLLIFDAVNGADHFFIIPMALIIPRRTIEITRYDVTAYSGRWAEFLEAWNLLHLAIEQAPPQPIQLNFLELPLCLNTKKS